MTNLEISKGQNIMKDSLVTKIYGKNLHAFVEKVFRSTQGNRLNSSSIYIHLVVWYLEQFLRGDIKKLLVNLPGRHLKTFICSVCFPAFKLGLDPTLKFMIVAYSEDIAEDIVRQIREVMESSWYKAAFKTRITETHSRKDDFTIKGGGRVRAVPVRSVTGKGGDIIILDDPHNVDDWNNDRKKEKVIEAFELLVSRRDGGKMSQMLVVGHRIAEDDLSAHILERGDFEHLCLPLFAPLEMTFEIDGAPLHLAKGEALRPDAFPPDEIESIRKNHRGSPFWLYHQQGLGPCGDDFEIKVSHFPFLPGGPQNRQLPKNVPVALSVDCAQKTNSTSRNVIHVYAKRGDRYDLIEAFAEKCSFQRLSRKVQLYAKRHNAWFVLVENTARGPDLIDELKTKLSMPVIPVTPRGTKEDRLRKFAPIIRAKSIRIRQSHATEEAIDEIVAYPNSPYDDHVDTLTNFLSEAPKFWATIPASSPGRESAGGATLPARPMGRRYPVDGLAIARGRSIFSGPGLPPDFSNGAAEPQRRSDGRSPYAAEDSSEPIYGFDGEKMVRLK
jgi:predicted phage terminase large subunit-like protein